jgi:hypothetical protein
VGYEPAIPTSERPQIQALDSKATEIGPGRYSKLMQNVSRNESEEVVGTLMEG